MAAHTVVLQGAPQGLCHHLSLETDEVLSLEVQPGGGQSGRQVSERRISLPTDGMDKAGADHGVCLT